MRKPPPLNIVTLCPANDYVCARANYLLDIFWLGQNKFT